MSTMFTVEERNLICVFAEESITPDTKSRSKVIQDISTTLFRTKALWKCV